MSRRQLVRFGALTLRPDQPYLIAEAGVNHENDLAAAFLMVEEAASAGADAIKFQSYKAERLASRHSPAYWDLDSESTTSQFELFKKFDRFGEAEYAQLAERCLECGIAFMSTPFDEIFADCLSLHVPAFKVASADITNFPLLRHIARKNKPVVLSTGASTIEEIEAAVRAIEDESACPIALLHCVLSYPCGPEDANLGAIDHLREAFPDHVIGYSDHVPPAYGCGALITAWLLGARILEKHFTLDKSLPGNDHYHAMDPDDIREFRKRCHYFNCLVGEGRKVVLSCEESARQHARRSVVAVRKIRAGEVLQGDWLTVKRPGTGIAPEYLEALVGARATTDIEEDSVLQWPMVARGD